MTAPADIARPSCIRDAFGMLVHLSEQDRAGLRWLKTRCQQWRNGLKRRRRYGMPRGCGYTEAESEVIDLLTALEQSAGRLLEIAEGKEVF